MGKNDIASGKKRSTYACYSYEGSLFGPKTITHEDLKEDMVLVGMYGIIDPPKPSAIEAIKKSHRAGISVKMITGDHKDTAVAIAKEIGLKIRTVPLLVKILKR